MNEQSVFLQVKQILKKMKGEYFDFEEDLITGGYISSFDTIRLIAEIEKKFSITVPVEIIEPESFDSIEKICTLIRSGVS